MDKRKSLKCILAMQDYKKYGTIFLALLLLALSGQKAQAQNAAFQMSTVGAMSNTSNASTPIQFKSTVACLDVQTGIAVLRGIKNNGEFSMNCAVSMQFNSLDIKMYPNPVQNYTKVKLQIAPPLNEVFNLSIWTTEGNLVLTRKETGYNLFQGLNIDLSTIVAGYYVLKIESAQFMDAIKFIKAN